jgi:hypothetical protein
MRIPAWLKETIDGERRRAKRGRRVRIQRRDATAEIPASGGDIRGSYGFGRRAHRPDPKARYHFDNDANYSAHHPRG